MQKHNDDSSSPIIKKRSQISWIWVLPILTLVLVFYYSVQEWRKTGPTITIKFQQAMGVTPLKTQVRYRDVKIGMVKSVRFNDSLDAVHVEAQIDVEFKNSLSNNSKFWIVTPKFSLSGISGLSTLFSGGYIEFDPGENGVFKDKFVGLENSPPVKSYQKGKSFQLSAHSLKSLAIGSPVYYRKVQVGEVTGYQLNDDFNRVLIQVFIHAPYHALVFEKTEFWDVSGLNVDLSASGVSAKIESITALLSGGIAFDLPPFELERTAPDLEQIYFLHDSEQQVRDDEYSTSFVYLLRFSSSARGLVKGAPVEIQGVKIGEVVEVKLTQKDTEDKHIYVLISIQPERIDEGMGQTRENLNNLIERMLNFGMRAQLKPGNLFTGALYIDLGLDESYAATTLTTLGEYFEIPTAGNQLEDITKQLQIIVSRLGKVPTDKIGNDIAKTVSSTRKIIEELEKNKFAKNGVLLIQNLKEASLNVDELLKVTTSTMQQAKVALSTLEPDTQLYEALITALAGIIDAAESLEALTDELARNPQSLIYGNKNPE